MEIKTVQWNIGGGKLLHESSDPALISSYNVDGLETIIHFLRSWRPDIITLQETHQSDVSSQPKVIAEALGYEGWINDVTSNSHIEDRQKLGHGIVSRFPILNHSFELFTNPHFKTIWEDGTTATSFDKGITGCVVRLDDGTKMYVQTLHLVPFRRFNIDPSSEKARPILWETEVKIGQSNISRRLVQGDFNLDSPSLKPFLPSLFEQGLDEVVQEASTTPKDRRLDHVLFAGMKLVESVVVSDVLTDHYPIVTKFK